MANIINLGTGSSTYKANDAYTTYVLDRGDRRTGDDDYAIDAMAQQVDGRTFEINGRIEDVKRGIQVGYGSDDIAVNVGKTGLIEGSEKAVMIEGDHDSVTNAGTLISGTLSTSVGIYVGGDDAHVTNSGFVSGYMGINVIGMGAQIENSGTVSGTYAIHISADAGQRTTLINSGTVYSSSGVAISGWKSDDRVTNSGTVHGDIQLDAGSDTFRNKGGQINGAVYGGDGNDTYITNRADFDFRETSVGGGYDTVKSSASFTMGMYFEEGWLTGKRNISLTGNDTGNVMYGNKGNNHITGDMGTDYITGGRGNDHLTGGDGLGTAGDLGDTFIFKNHSGRDVITDFQDGMDKIYLHEYDGIDSMADLKGHIKVDGDDLIVKLLDGDQIRIEHMDKINLSEFDFQF